MTQTSRIALRFGAFSCEVEGIADPVPLLQRLVTFCEEVEARNPDFGAHTVPLAELRDALSAEGPVDARVADGRLVLSRPAAAVETAVPTPATPAPEPELSSVEEIENKAVDMPDAQLSSALDRAMQQAAVSQTTTGTQPRLSLVEYASARRPRRIVDALEITAAYTHHMLGQANFDGVRLLSDVDVIDIGRSVTMDEKIAAFGQLLDRGTFKTTATDNVFEMSPTIAQRYR